MLTGGTVVHTSDGTAIGPQFESRSRGLLPRPRPGTRGEGSQMRRLSRPAAIRVGDRVRFAGQVRAVLAVSARAVTLAEGEASPREVPLAVLLGDESFEVLSSPVRMPLPPVSLLEALPEHAREKALWWEGHILEVLHGVDPNADEDAGPRPEYDPARHSLTARERAKAAELTAAGYQVSVSTIGSFRRRYQAEGLLGLADRRPVRKKPQFGTVDDAVVEAMRQAGKEGIDDSTRTGTYIIWRTGEILRENSETAELPSQSTLYRLLAKLTYGKPVSATARNRRSRAHGAKTPFGQWTVFAPGEVVQIDSTPLDVLVRLDDGVVGKIELTGMIDVATRTVPAAVLRPTTKSVDASVLLARTLTSEVMRPGWVDALRMSRSVLPYRRLLDIDERLEHAAAKPVIVPEMIVRDHGKVFISRNFKASCRFLEIDFQPTHKASPFQKGHVEKMLDSVGTLFAQFVAGYTGRSTDHRGRNLEKQPLWSLPELQELLDEWLVATWQNREHDGLRDPLHPSRSFTPNEKYAALIEACGYVPVALSAEDYIEVAAVDLAGGERLRHQDQATHLRCSGPDPPSAFRSRGEEGAAGGPSRPLRHFPDPGTRSPRRRRVDRGDLEAPASHPGSLRGAGVGPRCPGSAQGHRGGDRGGGRGSADAGPCGSGTGRDGQAEEAYAAGEAGGRPHQGHPADS